MSKRTDTDFREALIAATMLKRGCDRSEAEVILDRVAARLGGATHAEAATAYPLPAPGGGTPA